MSGSLPQTGSDCPPLVKLIKYGILGGLAAAPVSIAFRDFPADLLSQLWGAVRRGLLPEQVVEVWSSVHIQSLKNDPHSARVAPVYGGQGRALSSNILDWLVETRRQGGKPLPAVLSIHHRTNTDTPGTTLVAQGDADLCNDLERWLQQNNASMRLPEVDSDQALSVNTARLRLAIQEADKKRSLSVRDINIVTGLIIGAVINEAVQSWVPGRSIQAPGPGHYSEVHALLNARPFHRVEQPHDEITLHMVARANAYLRTKSAPAAVTPKRLGARAGSISTLPKGNSATTEHPRPITRRELADLGNPKSSVSKRLLEKVVQSGDPKLLKPIGVEAIDRLRPSSHTRPPFASERTNSSPEWIYKTTWTYKMVRNRFDRLQWEGIIEARRAAENAAIEYLLPEELING